mgnify:CR=1 FL=1|tara:strand:+ start:846 stop:2450 length:1605 start_codon:yes stop_codon:yes gene_type:complete
MAYKFQLGAAVMSGSLEQEGSVDITDSGVLKIAGSTLADASRNLTAAQVSGSGNLLIGGTVRFDGAVDAAMVATDGMYFLDSDGIMKRDAASDVRDLFFSAVSGDATVASGGALTIAAAAVHHGMLNDDIISGQDELAHADIADADELMISDAGTVKRVGVDSLRDHFFGVVSGDATVADGGALTIANDAVEQAMIADDAVGADQLAANAVVNASVVDGALKADKLDFDGSTDIGADLVDADLLLVDDGATGTNRKSTLTRVKKYIYSAMSGDATASDAGALTIANDAVESGMLNDNVISGQTELAHADIVDADELLISDGGVLKRVGVDSLRDHFFGVVSGDATVADGGALTIAANAVQDSMLHDDVATGLAGAGLSAASGVLALDLNELTAESIASGDFLPFEDSTDNGSHKITIDNLAAFMAGDGVDASGGKLSVAGSTVSATGDDDATLIEGFNYQSATLTADRTWTLPAPGGLDAGSVVRVKAGNLDGNKITVARNGATIDGVATDLELEANGAAISLMYIGSSSWQIF